MKTLVWAIVATAFSAFGLLLSLWGVDDRIIAKFPWSAPAVNLIPIASLTMLGLVFALFIVYLIVALISTIYIRTSSSLQNVTSVACREEDLPKIRKIAESEIGQVSSEEDTLALYRRNKQAFRKIVDTKTHEIIGYFCILPLTSDGLDRVKNRNLLEPPIDVKCFAQKFRKGADVYIGGIAGVGPRGKAGAHEQLKLFIVNKNFVTAYARPMTKRGVALARENGFKPVSENDNLVTGVYAYKIRSI
ncbi:hypothetical protein LB559_19430 [Mesorhizobium sp. BR1-1-3]|uniref:hypothetical protein n=1 Tax=Mesorhizobium sp. BR1-1-3 TaxID=2876651 RepID=UPI001CD1775B|nr:hypothetical protein [Mesorhizobium sp. BR1-1-3]MBZ9890100.1 hypothetical protein [Mesorhizobium sp. BR1-1-3]